METTDGFIDVATSILSLWAIPSRYEGSNMVKIMFLEFEPREGLTTILEENRRTFWLSMFAH